MQFFKLRVLLKRFGAIRFMMKDKSVKWQKKALIIAGIVYLFMPLDLLPFLTGPFSVIDDFIAWCLILYYLSDELDKYWLGEKGVDLSRKYKDTVDNVEYTVEDDDKGGPSRGE